VDSAISEGAAKINNLTDNLTYDHAKWSEVLCTSFKTTYILMESRETMTRSAMVDADTEMITHKLITE